MADTPDGRREKKTRLSRKAGATLDFLAGGGEMERRIRAFDWSRTGLGPLEGWPQSLKTALKIALNSRYPIWMGWGQELINLYNDPYIPVLGKRDDWALGASARDVWKEIWEEHLGPQADAVLLRGEASWNDQRQMVMYRNGYAEETYFTFSFSPLPADEGGIGGLFCTCTEDTRKVLGERRLVALRHLAGATTDARTEVEAGTIAARILLEHDDDVSFALIYLIADDGHTARLAAGQGEVSDVSWASPIIALNSDREAPVAPGHWPLQRAMEEGMQVLHDLDVTYQLPGGRWPEPATAAAVVPLARAGHDKPRGFLVVGASPRLPFDENYRSFFELLARGTADALSNARAYEEEKKRAEALAELDRAKTTFFSNVSHEFRTPLTLLLGPAEDLLAMKEGTLPGEATEQVRVIHRNALRMQRLVNTLLEFSRIEAGRVQASFVETDLAQLTADLASVFRSTMERAGLTFTVDCPPLPQPVWIDRRMWETVVCNLLSNAFKFTLSGQVTISLRAEESRTEPEVAPRHAPTPDHAVDSPRPSIVLSVRDTGVGIPSQELSHVFERFHRIEGSGGRTHEGTGIGLALAYELVKLHGGAMEVESELQCGTIFRVRIPLGSAHLPTDRLGFGTAPTSNATWSDTFIEEALTWVPEEVRAATRTDQAEPAAGGALNRPRVLVAEDNADMRDYVRRLLQAHYTVETVPHGAAALAAARRHPPDLILSDVMMPEMDGFELVQQVRADERLRTTPIILLSARSGDEARVEGISQGADDYIVKPFSPRELLARLATHLDLARIRHVAGEELRRSGDALRVSEERLRETNESLSQRVAELQRSNEAARDSRRAALNLLEDAVRAKQTMDLLNRQLQESEARQRAFAGQLEGLVKERTGELEQSESRLRALATELNLAEQRERKRLSMDLHDYLVQLLVVCRMALGQAKRTDLPERAKEFVKDTEEALDKALIYCRTLMTELNPLVLHEEGLPDGLRWLGRHMKQQNLEVVIEIPADLEVLLSEDCAVLMYQSVRELLINVAKHGVVKKAVVRMTYVDGLLQILVNDDNGFDLAAAAVPDNISPLSSKFGLFSIRERMRALGGTFDIRSAPGKGTRAMLTLRVQKLKEKDRSDLEKAPLTSFASTMPALSVTPGSTTGVIRVLLVDDHMMVREGLRGIVTTHHHLEVVGEAGDGVEAVTLAHQLVPHVVVMDINMPKMDGIEATKQINAPPRDCCYRTVGQPGGRDGTADESGRRVCVSVERVRRRRLVPRDRGGVSCGQ